MTLDPCCPTCRAEYSEGAKFCPACGAAREPNGGSEQTLETCEISLWRGYMKSRFYVLRDGSADADGSSLASPLFRNRRGEPAEEGVAVQAYKALVEELLTEGWEAAGRRRTWYSQRFVRRAEALQLEAPQVDVTPATEPAPHLEPVSTVEAPHIEPAPPVETHVGAPRESVPESSVRVADEAEWRDTEIVRGSGKQRIRVGTVLLFTIIVGVSAAVAPSLLQSEAAKGRTPAAQPVVKPERTATAKPVTRVAHKPRVAHITISATRGASWIEARSGSSTGPVLYSGVLGQGDTARFSARVVWVRLAAAAHVDVLVNGRPPTQGPLVGTVDVLLRSSAAG